MKLTLGLVAIKNEALKEEEDMRKIRGVKKLADYLDSINCPMSEATIYRLMRTKEIPINRPAPRVIIFDLDEIDAWLGGEIKN